MLKVVADENMPIIEKLFGEGYQLETTPGRLMSSEQLKDADILLVRSVTKVNANLLNGTPVRFVGTATIGTNHVDKDWLAQNGIHFASAPGCNAEAVVDYVIASLFQMASMRGKQLDDWTVGVVGVGNVGSRVAARLASIGCRVLLNDPPRAEQEGEAAFTELSCLLAEADVISLHLPLTRQGAWPTEGLLDRHLMAVLKEDVILLNAGRGEVINEQDLKQLRRERPHMSLVLDVWRNEPSIDPELLALADIATPHIAGYSIEGKVRGSWMLYKAWCETQGQSCDIPLSAVLPKAKLRKVEVTSDMTALELTRLVYNPLIDDGGLRRGMAKPTQERAALFDLQRKHYPARYEFSSLEISGELTKQQRQLFSAIGFTTS